VYLVVVERLGLCPGTVYVRYLAPVVEEALKAAFLVFRIRTGRVGFLVDAAIHGFAVGAGFALVENVYYLNRLDDAPLGVWVVRGFGTAVLHGSTTAMFAVLGKGISDRRDRAGMAEFPRYRAGGDRARCTTASRAPGGGRVPAPVGFRSFSSWCSPAASAPRAGGWVRVDTDADSSISS
jgi:hypothetical protein